MMPFDDEEKDKWALGDEEKQNLYDSLRAKYDDASDSSAVESAQNAQTRANTMGGIGQAFANYAANMAQTKGSKVQAPTGIGDSARKSAAQKLDAAKTNRKDSMDRVMTDADIDYKGQVRGRESEQWKRDDTQKAREDDPNSPESANAQALAKKMMPNGKFDGMSYTQIKGSLPSVEKMYQVDQARQARIDAARESAANRRDAKTDRDQAKTDKKTDDDEKYNASVKVEGADVMPGFRPSSTDAERVRKVKAAHDAINKQMDELDALHKSSGTNLVGEDATRQAQIVADVKLQLKDLQSLGALSGSDLTLLQDQVPDPTAWTENVKGVFGADRYAPKADQFRKSIGTRYDSTLSSSGYKRGGAGNAGSFVTMLDKNGKRMKVPADKAKMAEDAGWKKVETYAGE